MIRSVFVATLLMANAGLGVAQVTQPYQYMQLFYYGPKVTTGPILRFAPAYKGQTAIEMTQPDEYMKFADPTRLLVPSSSVKEVEVEAVVTTSEGTFVHGKRQTPEQLKQARDKEYKDSKAQLAAYTTMVNQHTETVTAMLSKAINSAAEDGWEVTQIASLENGGLVYLFRKGKK